MHLSIIIVVSTLQKTIKETKDDAIFIISSAVLVYFINYFFIYIDENRMKVITLDYATALMCFIPTMIFFAAILLFTNYLINSLRIQKTFFKTLKSS
jgi:hypothetical protein